MSRTKRSLFSPFINMCLTSTSPHAKHAETDPRHGTPNTYDGTLPTARIAASSSKLPWPARVACIRHPATRCCARGCRTRAAFVDAPLRFCACGGTLVHSACQPGEDKCVSLKSLPNIRRQRVFQAFSVPGAEQLQKLLSVGPQGYVSSENCSTSKQSLRVSPPSPAGANAARPRNCE